MLKHMDTQKISFCQVFKYPYFNPPWMTESHHRNAKHNNGTKFSSTNTNSNVNMVGKRKQVYVLTAGLVRVRHNTEITHEY